MKTNDMQYDEQVNLSTVQQGDVAVLRCGGECEATSTYYRSEIYFDGKMVSYTENGKFLPGKTKHPFDIIAIKRRPFDWSQVKPWMGFQDGRDGEIVNYIGPSPLNSNMVVVMCEDKEYRPVERADLTRAPEHDVEVDDG